MSQSPLASILFVAASASFSFAQVREEIVDAQLLPPSSAQLYARTIYGDELLGDRNGALIRMEQAPDGSWQLTQEISGCAQPHRLSADEVLGVASMPPRLVVVRRSPSGLFGPPTTLASLGGSPKIVATSPVRFVVNQSSLLSPNDYSYLVYDKTPSGDWVPTTSLQPLDKYVVTPRAWALDGDRILVSGWNAATYLSKVYEFAKAPSGLWLQVGAIARLDHVAFASFGESIALHGDTAFIGAPGNSYYAQYSGSVHVYERLAPGVWQEVQTIYDPELSPNSFFGSRVKFHDGRLYVTTSTGNGDRVHRFEKSVANDWLLSATYVSTSRVYGIGIDPERVVVDVALQSSGAAAMFEQSPLDADVATVSLVAGSAQTIRARFGNAWASAPYFCIGSASGTAPGIPLEPGLVLPLNQDAYLDACLLGGAPLIGQFGWLDGNGAADVIFDLPVGLDASLQGVTIDHVVITVRDSGTYGMPDWYLRVSNAVPVTLAP